MWHNIVNTYNNVVSTISGPLKESRFYQEGKLTIAEYIAAGDFLVQKCPSWKWCSSSEKLYDKNLPKEKQYLKTTVNSDMRAEDFYNMNKAVEKDIDEEWVDADLIDPNQAKKEEEKTVDLDEAENKENKEDDKAKEPKVVNDFEIVEDFVDNKKRTYDVSVTYDYYYCVPRMWLVGYTSEGKALTPDQMKQDIMTEYRGKTVTIDPHPCTGEQNISVHPCRHSVLLKKLIENFELNGKKLEPHMSILIFLKFLHSVVPTVQYDFTMDINF